MSNEQEKAENVINAAHVSKGLHIDSFELAYVNAGHVPALVRRAKHVFELAPTTQPLGYFKAADIAGRSFRLEKGDRLLLYTDGIIEAAGASGKRFGLEQLKRLLAKNESGHQGFLDQLFDSLRDFGASDPPKDDCSALVLDILGGRFLKDEYLIRIRNQLWKSGHYILS